MYLMCIDNEEGVSEELTIGEIYTEWRYDDFEEFYHVKNDNDKWEIYFRDRFEVIED